MFFCVLDTRLIQALCNWSLFLLLSHLLILFLQFAEFAPAAVLTGFSRIGVLFALQ
jgi:hypothetical protein